MSIADTIEREISINAPLARVWELVSEPGWWMSDNGDRGEQRRWREGDLDIVDDPRFGRYLISTEASEPPRYIAYRCPFEYPGEVPTPQNSTLIEFWLREQDGATLVRMVESGFVALAAYAATQGKIVTTDSNSEGWDEQMHVLKRNAEAAAA